MKNTEKFALTAMICVTLILCAGFIAYAIALPRFQVTLHNETFVINDRFNGEIFACTIAKSTYGCVRVNPSNSKIVAPN